MKTLFAILLAGLAGTAAAAPRAESATECGIAADMAVVARSLAQEEIKRRPERSWRASTMSRSRHVARN